MNAAVTSAAAAPAAPTSAKRRRLNPAVVSDDQMAFAEFLDANFFGQPDARALLLKAYANYRNPLRDKTKPIAFLVFAGESRTGKTEGARMIPSFVHKNRFALLKINCSEYMEKWSLTNLKGSPRGYVSNQTTSDEKYQNVPKSEKHGYAEFMNHNLEWSKQGSGAPLSVVLLDEWDKACYEFNLLLLQAMDDGQITLGSGEIVDFRNTIFIAACNSGMTEVESEESGGIGFNTRERKLAHGEVSSIVEKTIRKSTPPEFRNRLKELGGIAVFQSLDHKQMKMIVRRDLRSLQDQIIASGYHFTLSVTETAVEEILRRSLSNKGNLSNVKSLINTEIQIPLGIEASKGTIKVGEAVTVDVEASESGAVSFFLEVQDSLQQSGLSILEEISNKRIEASSAQAGEVTEDLREEEKQLLASLFSIGNGSLLGARSLSLIVMAMGDGTHKPSLGFPLADQLNALGLMPKVPAFFTGPHNLALLAKMSQIKSQVELYPELAQEFQLELREEKQFYNLIESSRSIVEELVTMLGVEILETKMKHEAPFSFSMKVKAHPNAVALAKIRFPKIRIRSK